MRGYPIESEDSPVLKMREISIIGNVVPNAWYKTIQRTLKGRGKSAGKEASSPYLEAITILAEIVYWYRPVEERDEITGEFAGVCKKFQADKLQLHTRALATKFGLSTKAVRKAISYLVSLGVVEQTFRNLADGKGGMLLKVQYLEIVPSILTRLSAIIPNTEPVKVPNTEPVISLIRNVTNTTTKTTKASKIEGKRKERSAVPASQAPLPGMNGDRGNPALFEMAEALAEAMNMDYKLNKPKLFGWASQLHPRYTAEQVLRAYAVNDCPWRKDFPGSKGQFPRWDEILKTIQKFTSDPQKHIIEVW